MMYGFGDEWPPNKKSVDLVESIITNYLEDLSMKATQVSELRGGKIDQQSFMFVVRKDRAKFNRVYTLLKTNDELKAAQQQDIAKGDEGS
jgi:transcription initiation factor TFIID subunit 13